jgi:hypothetical protein
MNDQANNNTIDQMISNYTYGADDIVAPDAAQFPGEQTQAVPNPEMNRVGAETPSKDASSSQNNTTTNYEPQVYSAEHKTDTITKSISNTDASFDPFQPTESPNKDAENHITQMVRDMYERERAGAATANSPEPIPGESGGIEYQTVNADRESIPGGSSEPIPGGSHNGIQGIPV